jgi:HAD superfamily, subfamily IIIB (Acid phosphatase)
MSSGHATAAVVAPGKRPVAALKRRMHGRDSSSVTEYKRHARIDIERKGYAIIANVGDQQSDLAFEHAERIFKIPNPFYYIP